MAADLMESEPEYRETLQVFDQEYLYLGTSGLQIFLEKPETNEMHEFGFWEFIEGRLAARGEIQ